MKTSFTALLSIAFFYPLNINAGEYFIALVPDGCYQKVIGNDNEFSKFANMMVDVEKSSVVVYESDYRNIFEIWKVIPDAGYSLRNAKASIRGYAKICDEGKEFSLRLKGSSNPFKNEQLQDFFYQRYMDNDNIEAMDIQLKKGEDGIGLMLRSK
ncbi:hypothetical protein [uncultured Marinobacter sp.]|jgi:hypothetical protein|uniref:hypothetical protein n=1 Tax=uncultured Marinobacter sp. TaxID=187379 RepID=UPI00258ECF09|nr:hypothetical protein [uncultured Marinobacter sp.]